MNKFDLNLDAIPEVVEKELAGFPTILKRLLFNKGITKKIEADAMIDTKYQTHDPFLMPNMKKATERILKAIDKLEKILIFADYDADGIPGAVILNDFFNKIGFNNFTTEIPDRHFDGFGLNKKIIEKAKKDKISLIITIDCGTASLQEIDLANKFGIDVVITDHHEAVSGIPKAVAIVNPKLPDSNYPYKKLCGTGVIYKVIQGLIKNRNFNLPDGFEKWLLDMVGIATLSDMVPLTGENRVFAKYGLLVLKKTPRMGLGALYNILKIKRNTLTEDDIVFLITPKINVASRLGSAKDAFNLLKSTNEAEAIMLAKKLNTLNNQRKGLVSALSKEIKSTIKERGLENKSLIVLGNPNWRPSLVGLVAGNISEELNKPVFLWGRNGENKIKGSCRAPRGINILTIMEGAKNSFLEFGGHGGAGGFSVSGEKIHTLNENLEKSFLSQKNIKNEAYDNKIKIDAILNWDIINLDLLNKINTLGPFGVENTKPLFSIPKTKVEKIRLFGKNKEHIAITFKDPEKDKIIEGISFFASKKLKNYFNTNEISNLIIHLEKDFYGNNKKVKFRIENKHYD